MATTGDRVVQTTVCGGTAGRELTKDRQGFGGRKDAGLRGRFQSILLSVAVAVLVWIASPSLGQASAAPNSWDCTMGNTSPNCTGADLSPMPMSRGNLGVATGVDGRIYAIGGYNGGLRLNTAQAYDPSTNTWTTLLPMPTAREALAVVRGPDGRIYAIGGDNGTAGGILNTVEAYNPSTNTWTTLAPMPTARNALAAVTGQDGRIYAIGGCCQGEFNTLTTVEAYTPSTNTWTTLAPMPSDRAALATAAGPDGRIYAIGGTHNFSGSLATVEAYTPNTNTWSTVRAMLTDRLGLTAVTGPDGNIYAIGGENNFGVLSTVEAYAPSNDSWSTVKSMPTPRDGPAAAAALDGRIFAIGGFDSSFNTLNTVEAYMPPVADTNPPVIIPAITGTLGNRGWYTSPVTVSWSVSDPESGIASSSGCDSTTLTSDTAGATFTCSATNGAGLTSSESVTIKIDQTSPSCSVGVSPNTLWPPDHKLVTVQAAVTVSDTLSGPAGFILTSVTSSEPNTDNSIQGFVIGTASTTGQLRAERNEGGPGRVYTLTYQASDGAGNTTTCTGTVRVPHDKGH